MMTELSTLCGLAILVPSPFSRKVNRWRRLYDPSYPALVPHLTLAYPPFVAPNGWDAVRDEFAAVIRRFSPFSITLDDVGTFESPWRVLWLKPREEDRLNRLRVALERKFPVQIPVFPVIYQPHVTIGLFNDETALTAARDAVRSEFKPITFEARSVDYLVQDPDGIWRVYDSLPMVGRRINKEKNGVDPLATT